MRELYCHVYECDYRLGLDLFIYLFTFIHSVDPYGTADQWIWILSQANRLKYGKYKNLHTFVIKTVKRFILMYNA